MRILFCSGTHLSKELGASKVLIELSEEMEQLGWQCTLVSPNDLGPALNAKGDYCERLRRYLIEHAAKYDIVEYDHGHLPYPRSEFPAGTLFVARSVLLGHHFNKITVPRDRSIKGRVRSLLFDRSEAARARRRIEHAEITVKEADLVNVLNLDDREVLVSSGIPDEKIVVIPSGISRSRRILFDAVSSAVPVDPVVVFVGTFDQRKGASDFPLIAEEVSRNVPNVRFRLLGTFRGKQVVLNHFPRRLKSRIDVLPRFHPDALPELLSRGSVGVFPSYVEGFGIGVLEMLAASIPVIAYNSPGPPMMLPPDYLVPRGDTKAASSKLINLLREPDQLKRARTWAKRRSHDFRWEEIAAETSRLYTRNAEAKRREAGGSV